MDLNDYIKQSYKRPNRQILESLGANEDLIKYLEMTPWNTNLEVAKSIVGSGSGNNAVVGEAIVGTAVI